MKSTLHNDCIFISRYNTRLKDAKNVGTKKGLLAGVGIGMISFFIYFVHAVGFWFGAYLIQYQDATIGDVLTVRCCVGLLWYTLCMCVNCW